MIHLKQSKRGKRAFSISEIIVSMALIVVISVVGFSACYLGMRIQALAANNVDIWNTADMFRSEAVAAAKINSPKQSQESLQKFMYDFNKRISFAINSYQPNFRDFQGDYALDSDPWTIDLVLNAETEYVPPENPDDQPTQQTTVLSGLSVHYTGSFYTSDGIRKPNNIFVYTFFNPNIKLTAKLCLRGEFYIEVQGFYAGSQKVTYTLKQELPV